MKWIAEGGSQAGIPAPVVTPRKSRERIAWSVAACLLVAFVAALALGAFAYFRRGPEDTLTMRFLLSPPEAWTLAHQPSPTGKASAPLAVSPDGHRIAFVAGSADGKSVLWVRSLDTLAAQALAGTDDAMSPFWSPDSRFLGFFAGGKLKKIEISGGPPIALCDAPDSVGGTWSRDGVIVFNATNSALQKVYASGGVPTAATVLGPGEETHRRPFFLPDGRHFLYNNATSAAQGQPIYMASLDSAERKFLLNADSTNVLYTQGHLLFLRETTLMAQPFDARRLTLTGEAFPIAEQILQSATTPPNGVFSASQNGVLAYQTGTGAAGSQLIWFDRTGKQLGVLGDPAVYRNVEISPDGKRASVSLDQASNAPNIWLYDVVRGLRTRFTIDPADELDSTWSPDGSRIVFNSRRKGHLDLYQKASSGAGTEEVLLEDSLDKLYLSWSPDGRFILYSTSSASPQTGADLFVLPLSGDRKPVPFLKTQFNELAGQFSPDGKWVAYVSNESGRNEVYVAPFPGPGGKWQISTSGGTIPRWRHDGAEIFYLAPDNKLMAAAVNGKASSFEVGAVKTLFQTRVTGNRYPYDVSADGQRFLINIPRGQQAAQVPITVVTNWQAELKK